MMTLTHDDTRGKRPTSRRRAADMMSLGLLSFDYRTPIREAAMLLKAHELDAAPVLDERRVPLGVLTARACAAWEEFTRRSSGGIRPEGGDDGAVSEIVDPAIEVIAADASREEVLERLQQVRGRRLYVVSETGAAIGVISASDVLRDVSSARPRPAALQSCGPEPAY